MLNFFFFFFLCCDSCVELFLYVVLNFFYFIFLKLIGYNLIFKDFFFLSTSKYKFGIKYFLFFNMGSFYSNLDKKYTKNTKNKLV